MGSNVRQTRQVKRAEEKLRNRRKQRHVIPGALRHTWKLSGMREKWDGQAGIHISCDMLEHGAVQPAAGTSTGPRQKVE